MPESQSLKSDRAVKAANPAPTITLGSLREQRERVTPLAFAQFHACRWGVSEAQWLPPGAWRPAEADFEVEEGEPLFAGIDIGGSRAASALVAVTEDLRVAARRGLPGRREPCCRSPTRCCGWPSATRSPRPPTTPGGSSARRCDWSASTGW